MNGDVLIWIGWFSKFGIQDPETAKHYLIYIGLLDLVIAVIILIKPIKVALLFKLGT